MASPDEPSQRLKELGAKVVHSLTAAEGPFSVVMESVGGRIMSDVLPRISRGALILWFGQASFQPITLDFFSFFVGRESVTLRHFVYSDAKDANDRRDIAELLELIRMQRLHVEIGYKGDWSETASVLNRLQDRQTHPRSLSTGAPSATGREPAYTTNFKCSPPLIECAAEPSPQVYWFCQINRKFAKRLQ